MKLEDWIEFASRWKWLMIFIVLLIMFITSAYCVVAKEVYKSSTTILVLPQSTPEDYIKETATYHIADRLDTIKQQVLSRTRLLEVIEEFNLFPQNNEKIPQEILVEKMRKRIKIELKGDIKGSENVFRLEYFDEEPQTAMLVTTRLASSFMEKNLSIRAEQTMGTARVINQKLRSIKKKLDKKKRELDEYKRKYSGELPEQRTSNLGMLTRFQEELKSITDSIRTVEARITTLKDQFGQMKHKPGFGLNKNRLTEEHNLKIEQEEENLDDLKMQRENIIAQIDVYSLRLENTPTRELELNKFEREYNNLLITYEELLGKQNYAEMANDLEKIQKNIQFQVIDPAYVPEKPDRPKRKKILFLAFVLSLSVGVWSALLLEQFDKSIKSPGEFKEIFNLPVLASLPEVFSMAEKRRFSPQRTALSVGLILYGIVVFIFSCCYFDRIKILFSKLLSNFLILG